MKVVGDGGGVAEGWGGGGCGWGEKGGWVFGVWGGVRGVLTIFTVSLFCNEGIVVVVVVVVVVVGTVFVSFLLLAVS